MLRQVFRRRLLVIGIVSFGIGMAYNHFEMKRFRGGRATSAEDEPIYSDEELDRVCDYHFDENGVLVHQRTGKKFEWESQDHYERVSLYVWCYVQNELRRRGFTQRDPDGIFVLDRGQSENVNEDAVVVAGKPDSPPRILVLIPGSGRVLAGIWSRKICINENLQSGSMLPIVDRALADPRFTEIYVMNPNNRGGSSDPHQLHVYETWKEHLRNKKNIFIIAHSFGGVSTLNLLSLDPKQFMGRVRCCVFTDSVHWFPQFYALSRLSEVHKVWLRSHSRNWIASKSSLGTSLGMKGDCPAFSAGTNLHEWTTHFSTDAAFDFFDSARVKKEERL